MQLMLLCFLSCFWCMHSNWWLTRASASIYLNMILLGYLNSLLLDDISSHLLWIWNLLQSKFIYAKIHRFSSSIVKFRHEITIHYPNNYFPYWCFTLHSAFLLFASRPNISNFCRHFHAWGFPKVYSTKNFRKWLFYIQLQMYVDKKKILCES